MAHEGFAGPVISYEELEHSGVRLLNPKSAGFQSVFQSLKAGRSPDVLPELLTESLPYAVIVQNMTTRSVAAIVVMYGGKGPSEYPLDYTITLYNTHLAAWDAA
jgi:hypothetical protein